MLINSHRLLGSANEMFSPNVTFLPQNCMPISLPIHLLNFHNKKYSAFPDPPFKPRKMLAFFFHLLIWPTLLLMMLTAIGPAASEPVLLRYPANDWEVFDQERPNIELRQLRWADDDRMAGSNSKGQATRFRRNARSAPSSDLVSELAAQQPTTETTQDWLFADDAALLKKLAREEDEGEPLVFSRYNRDCFFTPVNCFVGRAGQQASNIVGSASNSKRQILFIKRRHNRRQNGARTGLGRRAKKAGKLW